MASYLMYFLTDKNNSSAVFTVVQQEQSEVQLRKSITDFSKEKLHHADMQEKNPLPDPASMDRYILRYTKLTFIE